MRSYYCLNWRFDILHILRNCHGGMRHIRVAPHRRLYLIITHPYIQSNASFHRLCFCTGTRTFWVPTYKALHFKVTTSGLTRTRAISSFTVTKWGRNRRQRLVSGPGRSLPGGHPGYNVKCMEVTRIMSNACVICYLEATLQPKSHVSPALTHTTDYK